MLKKNVSGIKFLRTRLFLDDLKSIFLGWYFKITDKKIVNKEDLSNWHCLSDFRMNINWREELGEINHSRIHNMSLGSESINNTILKPGEVFSLRKVLQEATVEKGYAQGPVFRNGKTTYTTGGGLCLVSSVIFNAVLLANLKILEKYNHSTDLWGEDRFIDLGRDATYVYGRKDFKFKNNHNNDIVIKMGVSKEDLIIWCKILSPSGAKYNIRIESTVLQEIIPKDITQEIDYRRGWKVITKRYIDEGQNKKLTYKKHEIYKPFILGNKNKIS